MLLRSAFRLDLTSVARVPVSSGGPGYLYMGSQTAYVTLLGPFVPLLRPSRPLLCRKSRPGAVPEAFWAPQSPPGGLKTHVKYSKNLIFYSVSCFSAFLRMLLEQRPKKAAKGGSREPKMRPRRSPGGPRSSPRGPRSGPGGPRSGPRGPKRPPRAPRSAPKGTQKGVKKELCFRFGPRRASGSLPGAMLGRFVFGPSGEPF